MAASKLKSLLADIGLTKLLTHSFEVISLLNSSFEIVYRSPNAERITGWVDDDRLGRRLKDLLHPDDAGGVIEHLLAISGSPGSSKSCSFRAIRPDGDYMWIDASFTNLLDDPDIGAIVCHYQDISEVRKSRSLLDQTNSELYAYKYALDESAIVAVTDQKGVIKHVNENFCRISGYSASELIGQDHRVINSSFHDKAYIRDLWATIASGKVWRGELRNRAKDGSYYWVYTTIVPFTNEQEKPYQFVAIRFDVSQRREMEDLLTNVSTLAGIGGWLVDIVKNIVFWSPITMKIHEVEEDFEPDMPSALAFYKEEKDRELVKQHIYLAAQTGQSFDFEAQIVTARHNVKWVRVIGKPEFENNACVRVRGSFQDIDARKKAELAASQALEEKNTILESIGDAFFAVDRNWIVTYWNNIAETVLFKSKQQMEGKYLWDVFSDSVGSRSYQNYLRAVETNEAIHFEDFYPPLKKWYDISAYPSSNGLSVYFKDITERKYISSALEESERNYSSLFQLSPLPMWVFDVQTLHFLDVNQAAIDHYGYSENEFLSMTIEDIRQPQDLPHLHKALAYKSVSGVAEKRGIFRHLKKNGELIQADIQSNDIQYRGKPAKVVVAHDMTERFTYVHAIEEQNAKFREIAFQQSHVVRAPLARIMGIVPMLQNWETFADERDQLLEFLQIAASELDEVVKDISEKTGSVPG